MRARSASCQGAKRTPTIRSRLLATLDSPQTRFIYNVAEYITDPAAHANAAIIASRK